MIIEYVFLSLFMIIIGIIKIYFSLWRIPAKRCLTVM
jgi:hypothetical protein